MILTRYRKSSVSALAMLMLSLAVPAWATGVSGGFSGAHGPRFSPSPKFQHDHRNRDHHDHGSQTQPGGDTVRRWNEIAIDASGLDHTPVADDETRVFGEQLGPGRSSRAIAIVHIAVFDAVNAIVGGYRSYTRLSRAVRGTSMDAAVAQAAHDTLVALFPSQAPSFDAQLAEDLSHVRNRIANANGRRLGKQAAAKILALRTNDGSQIPDPHVGVDFTTGDQPGQWRVDPVSGNTLALGAYWGAVRPFVLTSSDQFRVPAPPSLDSLEYAEAFNDVKAVGGDGMLPDGTPTIRTEEQTEIGIYWAYDGTPSLCAPPRLYNQIAVQLADQMGTTSNALEFARLMALVNVAMADAGITAWESKYFYNFWRPVTGIREADLGSGPSGLGDGNADTSGDPGFSPLGAPASNLVGPNFTPPFPAYPSGHAVFGASLFETLRAFYGTDDIAFTFVSDELNGTTLDNQGIVRPLIPRSFASLSQAEDENGQSRIYLGIHWRFDKDQGIVQGRNVGDYVINNAFRPVHRRHR